MDDQRDGLQQHNQNSIGVGEKNIQMAPNSVDGVTRAFEDMDMHGVRFSNARRDEVVTVTEEQKESWRLAEFYQMVNK